MERLWEVSEQYVIRLTTQEQRHVLPELGAIKENDKKQKYVIMLARPKLRLTYSRTLFNINCMCMTGNKLPAHTAQWAA